MSTELTPKQFSQKLYECVKEYKKQLNNTRDDGDAAHFFNASLKKFLKDHEAEMNILSNLNFEKPFMSWLKNYLMKGVAEHE